MKISQGHPFLARLTHETHQIFLTSRPRFLTFDPRSSWVGASKRQRAPMRAPRASPTSSARARGRGRGLRAAGAPALRARAPSPRGARLRRARRRGGRREGPFEVGERRCGRPSGRLPETGAGPRSAPLGLLSPLLRSPSAAPRGPEEAGGTGARRGSGPAGGGAGAGGGAVGSSGRAARRRRGPWDPTGRLQWAQVSPAPEGLPGAGAGLGLARPTAGEVGFRFPFLISGLV